MGRRMKEESTINTDLSKRVEDFKNPTSALINKAYNPKIPSYAR